MSDVIDLEQARVKRVERATAADHAAGAAFKFIPFRFDEERVGLIADAMPVVMVFDPINQVGVRMTREDALRLSDLLRETATDHPEG